MASPRKPSKNEVIRERWLRGRLGYKLHAGQWIIRNAFDRSAAHSQLFVGECARQFGKSILEAVLALEKAFSKPKAKVKIGTAFQTDLLEFIIPAFDMVMEDCPEDIRPVFKVQGSKYVLPHNKSEIKLVGLDRKPNGLRGTVIDLIILSEAGFISNLHYLFKSVIIPATTHRPDCRVTMLSTPPETPAHEFLDYVAKAEYENAYIKLTIYDNPLVDETTIARLMRESGGAESTTWRREYLCEHVTDENLAIISDWKDEFVEDVPRDVYYPFYHKYTAMDLGVRDHTAGIFGYYEFLKGRLVIEDEFIMNGPQMTTLTIKDEVIKKESDLWGKADPYLRVSDNNNLLLINDLSNLHNLHFMPTNKERLEEMVNTVKMLVRKGGVVVHPRCKQMKGCLKYGVWEKKKRDKFARSEIFGHFDALAALIYLVRNLNQTSNPIPRDFTLDRDNQILLIKTGESETASNFKKAFGVRG